MKRLKRLFRRIKQRIKRKLRNYAERIIISEWDMGDDQKVNMVSRALSRCAIVFCPTFDKKVLRALGVKPIKKTWTEMAQEARKKDNGSGIHGYSDALQQAPYLTDETKETKNG
jgi:hypothetical protein